MPRPKGFKYDPTKHKKPGRKPGATKIARRMNDDKILDSKVRLLELMSSGECRTLSSAAEKLGLNPTRVHWWAQDDPEFKEMVKLAREVAADKIEEEFQEHKNFIPKMMLLKGYRPMFRDSYRTETTDSRLYELLQELRELGRRSSARALPSPDKSQVIDVSPIEVENKTNEGERVNELLQTSNISND